MFFHIFYNRLKILLRTKVMIFWTLIFPLALATFFNLAFSNLASEEKFEVISIGVIEQEIQIKEPEFNNLIKNLSQKGEDQLFNLKYYENEKAARESLTENEITGIYLMNDEKIEVIVKQNGIESTMMKMVADEYYQTSSLISHLVEDYPESLKTGVLNKIEQEVDYFDDRSNDKIDTTVVYFYTLLGMACIYAGFFGIDAVDVSEANQSKKGTRLSISPTNKLKALLAALLAGFLIQFIENLILLAYLIFGLNIDFGNQIGWILLVMGLGSVAGISLGTLIGAVLKGSGDFKTTTHLIITLFCSFLAGMMMIDIKYFVAKYVPIIGYINPVNLITDALYSLYYYDNLNRYFFNIIGLIVFSCIMIIISYQFLRRKKYDSI